MTKVMLTLSGRSTEPKLSDVISELALKEEEVDLEYGVQMIDPVAGDYVILVEEAAALRVTGSDPSVEGPFSNPRIEAFGPPQRDAD
ncbi:MAG: hypothetical protein B7733_20425 [Myxococcales bacterium FL481]|nr:MAG: hypothetical protein B7733_20425 [Myxococcales bacterium FL481]